MGTQSAIDNGSNFVLLFYSRGLYPEFFVARLLYKKFRSLPEMTVTIHPSNWHFVHRTTVVNVTANPLNCLRRVLALLRQGNRPQHMLYVCLEINDLKRDAFAMVQDILVDILAEMSTYRPSVVFCEPPGTLAQATAHAFSSIGRDITLGLDVEEMPPSKVRLPSLFPVTLSRRHNALSRNITFNRKASRLLAALALRHAWMLRGRSLMPADRISIFLRKHALLMLKYSACMSKDIQRNQYKEHFCEWPELLAEASMFALVSDSQSRKSEGGGTSRIYVGPLFEKQPPVPFAVHVPTLLGLVNNMVDTDEGWFFTKSVNNALELIVPYDESISFCTNTAISSAVDNAQILQRRIAKRITQGGGSITARSDLSGLSATTGFSTVAPSDSFMSGFTDDSLSHSDSMTSVSMSMSVSATHEDLSDSSESESDTTTRSTHSISGMSLHTSSVDKHMLNEVGMESDSQKRRIVDRHHPSSNLLSCFILPSNIYSAVDIEQMVQRFQRFEELEESDHVVGDDQQFWIEKRYTSAAMFRIIFSFFMSEETLAFINNRRHQVTDVFSIEEMLALENKLPDDICSIIHSSRGYSNTSHWWQNFLKSGDPISTHLVTSPMTVSKRKWVIQGGVYHSCIGDILFYLRVLEALRIEEPLSAVRLVILDHPPSGHLSFRSGEVVEKDGSEPPLYVAIQGYRFKGASYDTVSQTVVDCSPEDLMGFLPDAKLFAACAFDPKSRGKGRSRAPRLAISSNTVKVPLIIGGAISGPLVTLPSQTPISGDVWALRTLSFRVDFL
eukprot:gnl/Dysnectes_brevis/6858_a10962_306.p1 GENE.gnl/Dysnectes_brevis/6858_a10962_306~~gnl/Dysnectes_brevis/6858_a10962_306.p1  ORF type:complete len:884 (-),score=184.07 gnl/Dysnectes_brevis/6858_a10962_306:189-2546(-)